VDFVVTLTASINQVEKCPTDDGRDVYRVPYRDLELTPDMNPTISKISKTGDGGER